MRIAEVIVLADPSSFNVPNDAPLDFHTAVYFMVRVAVLYVHY
jgi:hypothetical protein